MGHKLIVINLQQYTKSAEINEFLCFVFPVEYLIGEVNFKCSKNYNRYSMKCTCVLIRYMCSAST